MSGENLTSLLNAARGGDQQSAASLFSLVYQELRQLAKAQRRRWRGNETLNTTALIHEAFLKLSANEEFRWENRTHFFATAAKAMRQVLVTYAEMQRADKRGGDAVRVPLEDQHFVSEATSQELLEVEELLRGLEAEHPRRCRVVECRVFAGMSLEETASALDVSVATVKRDWQIASAMLYRSLNTGTPGE